MPISFTTTKSANTVPADSSVSSDKLVSGAVTFAKLASDAIFPRIVSIQITDSSYTVLDDTAVDIAGGYIKINGTGFKSGCSVLINNTSATSTTFVNSNEIRAQLPASNAGTYIVYVSNSDGGTATKVNGITFSATPSWVTSSSLNNGASGQSYSFQLSATSATSYSLQSGSSLPSGLTLSSSGLISGTAPSVLSETSYSFTIVATDAELQDSPRTFSLPVTAFGSYLTTDLFMHYDFSNPSTYNGSGTSITDLQGTRNGTVTGATFGGSGLAKYFDFEADSLNYITFGSNIPTGQSTSALSIEAWVYIESMAGTYMSEGIGAIVSSQQDGGTTGASLNTDTRSAHSGGPNCFHPQIGNGGGWATGSYNTPSGSCTVSNRWDHVVMTWSNGNPVDVYKNGTKISTNTSGWSSSISWSNCYWSLGQQQCNIGSPSRRAFDGKIAIARIYNRGLSSAEVLSNYNGQKSRFGL